MASAEAGAEGGLSPALAQADPPQLRKLCREPDCDLHQHPYPSPSLPATCVRCARACMLQCHGRCSAMLPAGHAVILSLSMQEWKKLDFNTGLQTKRDRHVTTCSTLMMQGGLGHSPTAWSVSLTGRGDHPLQYAQSAWGVAMSGSSTRAPAQTPPHSWPPPSWPLLCPQTLRTQCFLSACPLAFRGSIYGKPKGLNAVHKPQSST